MRWLARLDVVGWRPWFAWYPVLCREQRGPALVTVRVWLERIERCPNSAHAVDLRHPKWHHKIPGQGVI